MQLRIRAVRVRGQVWLRVRLAAVKYVERRTKREHEPGGSRWLGTQRSHLQKSAIGKYRWPAINATCEVRGETRHSGPTRRQKRWLSRLKSSDMQPIAGLSGQGRWAGGATTCRSRLKSLTQYPRTPGTALPRGRNSACRGEWRREPGSPKKAPNAGSGKRVWRTPTPICPCPAGWPRRGICFICAGCPAFSQDLMPDPTPKKSPA